MKFTVLLLSILALGRCQQQLDEVGHASLVASVGEVSDVNKTQQTSEEEKENERLFMQEWARVFFSMGRIPSQGEQLLIFPGLFGGATTVEVTRPRELRSFSGQAATNGSSVLPTYTVDGPVTTGPAITPPKTSNVTRPNLIHLSNDSRLLLHDEPYHFGDVESLDEDQRQRRRLLSARNEMNLLNADKEHISLMINTVFSTARNFIDNQTVRANVVRYLTHKMRSFGLVTGNQIFHPQEFPQLFEGSVVPNGTNVIGILPGELWGTKDDEVLVIGAHWDTVPFSGGMDDNGSGVTAVLEVARAMTEGGCRPKHSVIFVTFDLEEVGCLGSIYFVRDFLINQILKPHGAKLKGAYILDTIMNYNVTQFSQTLSPEWQAALPDFWEDIKAENRTGDFLALLYRKGVDSSLADVFASNWKSDGKKRSKKNPIRESASGIPRRFRVDNKEITIMKTDSSVPVETLKSNSSKYRLKKVRMDLEAEVGDRFELLTAWIDLLRSDHSRFWYHNIEEYPQSIPAVLITDTAPYRGVMQDCYHQECDSSKSNKHLEFGDVQFLTKTCQALIDSIVSLSESKCLFQPPQPESSKTPRPFANIFSTSSFTSNSYPIKSSLLFTFLGVFLTVIQLLSTSST